ncbi:MAG: TRAP transporter substrate-binding protein [Rhodospirillaceae bacterium]
MKTFGRLLRVSTLGVSVACLSAGAAMAAEFEFKLHHLLSAKSPAHVKMITPWVDRIEKASGGRIKIEIYPSMSLGGKPPQLPRQVRDHVVDLAWFVNAYAAGTFPRTEVFELPGVHQGSTAAVNRAMFDMYQEYLKPDFKELLPMFQHVHAGQAIQMASKLVRSPADMQGLKIRIPSRTGAWVLEALGASPVKTSVGEIPVALSKGVVDGAMIPFEIIPPLKIQQQTKYQIEGPGGKRLGTTAFMVAMNSGRWNGLPADIQKIFMDNSGADWHAEVGRIWEAADVAGIGVATKSGNEHIQLTDAEWKKFEDAVDPVVARWINEMEAKGIPGQKLYDTAKALVTQYTAEEMKK